MSDPAQDPFVRQLRQQISDNDRALVGAINKRLELVSRLKAYKESRGFDFVDTTREQTRFQRFNGSDGPLSPDGLSALYTEVLALTKREVAPDDGA